MGRYFMKYKFLKLFVLALLIIGSVFSFNLTKVQATALCSTLGSPTVEIKINENTYSGNSSVFVTPGDPVWFSVVTIAEPSSQNTISYPGAIPSTIQYNAPSSTGRSYTTSDINSAGQITVFIEQYCTPDPSTGPTKTVTVNLIPNLGCSSMPPAWNPASVAWKTAPSSQVFNMSQSYTDRVSVNTVTDSCTAPATNGATCQAMGVSSVEYQDFDPCPEIGSRQAWKTSPANKIDALPPVCGSWSGTGSTRTLSSSTDAPASGVSGSSGISVAGGTCTAPCSVTISDIAGNTTSCPNPASVSFNVTATATGATPSSLSKTVPSGLTTSFGLTANPGYDINTAVVADSCSTPPGEFSSGKTLYTTGSIEQNCSLQFTLSPIAPTLSCAHDTNQAEPIYPNAGAKFRATGGNGTYSWSYSATPAAGNATTGIEVWPAWTNSGTKTATVTSGGQNASCTVYITPAVIPPSGSISATDCTIPLNGSSCNTTLNWSTSNPVGTSNVTSNTPSANTVVGSVNSGTTTASVPATAASFPSRTFFLNNNGSVLATATATASCISGSTWNGTLCQLNTTPINGACSASHYYCVVGTSVNNVDGASAWTWTCNGSGGGTNASCSEDKTFSPNLTASAPTPSSVMIGTPVNFSSTISNIGDASTGASFYNLFQRASAANGGGTITDITPAASTDPLTVGANRSVSSPSVTFTTVGTYSVRACADKSNAASFGTINESNEGDNCSGWTNVTVTNIPPVMSGTLTASDCTLVSGSCVTNLVWTTTNAEATSEVTTPTNVSVGTGLNNSGTYTLTSAGSRTFYLYNNAKLLAQATATASATPPPSCTDTGDFTGSVTPSSVPVFGPYTLSCNFEVVSGYIGGSLGSGSCSWGGWSGKGGTQANFNCTAGPTPGDFSNSCIINYDETYPYCSRTEAVNSLTVTALPGGRIDGTCSDPDNHVNPCLSGTPGAVTNGISSWTWTCSGSDVNSSSDDVSCEELKKKPIFIED